MLSNAAAQAAKLAITYTKLYVPVETLSIQDNAKLLLQLKSAFKRTINWNNYQPKVTKQAANLYIDYLVDPSFHEVRRRFV